MDSKIVANAVFTARQTHGRALRSGNRLLSHSQDVGWRPIHAAVFEEAPFSATEAAIGHPSLIFHLSHPTTVTRSVEGECRDRALIGPRQFCLTPGESNTVWQHNGYPEILQIYLRQSIFARTVEEMYGGDGTKADVVPGFAFADPLLEQLAIAIMDALRSGTSEDRIYIETLAQMMAAQLARSYSTRSRAVCQNGPNNLPRPALRRLVDYIETHLADELSLELLAVEAGMSTFHLSRVFKDAVGQPPHQYVLTRRVERAKDLLRDTARPIADVALSVGFSSQSHLSNSFRRMVGVSPGVYRKVH